MGSLVLADLCSLGICHLHDFIFILYDLCFSLTMAVQ